MGDFSGNDRLRRNVLLVMMAGTVVFGCFFIYHNLNRGLVGIALIEIVFITYTAALIPVTMRTRHLKRVAPAFVLPWTAAMIAILLMPGAAVTVFIWPLLLPLVLHFLLGRRLGLTLSLIAYAAILFAAWIRFGWPEGSEQTVVAGNMITASVLGLLLAYVYERGRELDEQRLRTLAATDQLTALPNRTALDSMFTNLSAKAIREDSALSALMLDLDHFKQINDRHGHAAGDQVLVEIARLMKNRLRGSDCVFRLGGEEFLVLLPDTSTAAAARVAEELRNTIESQTITAAGRSIAVTASIGVAELDPERADLDSLLRIADRRLYRAKELGRNRVEISGQAIEMNG